uniref:Uncharacterized protein n=1 Tax=Thermosporothrix sp. COM3 TaxID=2490863 RepID=A0A455SKK1_9CHLR|nr:hypothetical protein KTC_22300 [Thermosporothrix sp. COM3]
MNLDAYLEQLSVCLQRYGLDNQHISDIIAEVESHVAESGESPLDAFGPPEAYADARVTDHERRSGGAWQYRTFRATAFDEMLILQEAGQAGWELVDVAAFALYCRRPWDPKDVKQWEYTRCVGLNRNTIISNMLASRWEPCGNWTPFHYFKRAL